MPTLKDNELPAAWRIEQDERGITGYVQYLVPKSQIFSPELPVPGEAWPIAGQDLPWLKCRRAEWEEAEGDVALCTYHYTTGGQLGEHYYQAHLEIDMQTMDVTKGLTWEDANIAVVQPIATAWPTGSYYIRMRRAAPPNDLVEAAVGRVNQKVFHGFAAETMLFTGMDTSESYDREGNGVDCEVTFHFAVQPISHNYVWREPTYDVDADGNTLIYQDKDNTKGGYTVDPAKIGTPVPVAGTAGTAGWDKPTSGNDPITGLPIYRYGWCDFAAVLGIPRKTGDG